MHQSAPLALPPAQIQYPSPQTTVIQQPLPQVASPTWQDLISEPLPPTTIQQPVRKNIFRAAKEDPLTTILAGLVLLVGLMLGANWVNPQAGSLLLQKLKGSEPISQPAPPAQVDPSTPSAP